MKNEFVLFGGELTHADRVTLAEVAASFDSSEDCFYGYTQEVTAKIATEERKTGISLLCKLVEEDGGKFEFVGYDTYRDKFETAPSFTITHKQAEEINALLTTLISANQESADKYVKIVEEVARFSAPVDVPVEAISDLKKCIGLLDQDERTATLKLLNLLEIAAAQRDEEFLGGDFMFVGIRNALA